MSKNKLITYIPITLLQVLIILLMVLFCYKLSQNVVGTSWQDEYLKKKDNTIDSLIIIEKHHIDEINSLSIDPEFQISIIIVNDASNHDRSNEQKTLENLHSVKILNMKKNQGYLNAQQQSMLNGG